MKPRLETESGFSSFALCSLITDGDRAVLRSESPGVRYREKTREAKMQENKERDRTRRAEEGQGNCLLQLLLGLGWPEQVQKSWQN